MTETIERAGVDWAAVHATWGANIRAAREHRGLSQRALARELGINNGHLNRIENGTRNPRCRLRYAIAEALGTTVEALCPYPEPARTQPADAP